MKCLNRRVPRLGWVGGIVVVAALIAGLPLDGSSAEVTELMVVGVVIPDHGIRLTAIEDRTAMRTRFYRVGDSVNGGVITAIAPDRVTIAFGDELMLFRLAGVAASVESGPHLAPDSRRRAQATLDAVPRWDGVSSPYGGLGAITPSFPRPRAGKKSGGDAGGVTGGGGVAGAGAAAGVGVAANTTAIRFTGVLHGGSEQPGQQFSGQSLRDLLITVTHTNLLATNQRIELSTPDGGLYQKFSGDATPANQLRVPIGGTWITEHGLFGTWIVRVYLDREPMPAATAAFILNP